MSPTIATPTLWAVFIVVVVVAIAIDFLVTRNQGAHKVSMREALIWSVVWVAVAMAFNLWLWWHLHSQGNLLAEQTALEFLTGYVVEKSLAIDNIFVFLMIFSFFGIPPEYQKRALSFGILLAIVLRAVMIFVGAWLLTKFHWMLYVFGAFLLLTGAKMLWAADKKFSLDDNPLVRWMRNHWRITNQLHGEKLFVMQDGVRWATPLLLVLVMIGITDVIFAVDSIPAIFAITADPYIVLTSNVFAILGLRALYFLLADMADRFHYLSYGLATVLVFIGSKMLLIDVYKIPIGISLGVVGVLIGTSVAVSLMRPKPATQH